MRDVPSNLKTANGVGAKYRRKYALPIISGLIIFLSLWAYAAPGLFNTQKAIAAPSPMMIDVARSGFADLVDMVKPSVVSIMVVHSPRTSGPRANGPRTGRPHLRDRENGRGGPRFGNPDRRNRRDFSERRNPRFDRDRKRRPRRPSIRRSRAQGSGFIVSQDGFVVTNHHVVKNAKKVRVTLDDGKTYDAKVVGTDQKTDLALLKIEANRKFKPVKFSKKPARVGDWVVAVGNPFGLGGTVTTGIVSALGRAIGRGSYSDYLQIDAAINRGNSGGPAFNLQGEVIGVNTAIYSPSGGNVGIAFAIPAAVASHIIDTLKTHGKVTRGWLGVRIQRVSDDIAESLGLKQRYGAMVVEVTKNSPAELAGLKTGDTILEVGGKRVKGPRDLARKIGRVRPGTSVDINILRDGKRITKNVAIKTLANNTKLASVNPRQRTPNTVASLGLRLLNDNETDAVLIAEVDPNSPAATKGLRRGDKILEVAGKPVTRPSEVSRQIEKALEKGRRAVLLLIRRGTTERFVALPLKKKKI